MTGSGRAEAYGTVFDDDTPLRVPEAARCATWGGQAITVPYLSGRSTTQLLEEVRRGR